MRISLVRNAIVRLPVLCTLMSCYASTIQPGIDTRSRIIAKQNSVIRLKVKNRVPFDMRRPRIVGDSVIGIDHLLKSRTAVLLDDVEWADISQGGAGGAVAVGTIVALVVLCVLFGLVQSSQ